MDEMDTFGGGYLAMIRPALMGWATWALFTPSARAWSAHRPEPDESD